MAIFSDLSMATVGIMLCVAVASYVQNLTGFGLGLIFLGLVSTFHLMPALLHKSNSSRHDTSPTRSHATLPRERFETRQGG